jgi:hypothetical protein
MIFAHSFSTIEKRLANKISLQLPITQLDLNLVSDANSISQVCSGIHHFTFTYSFQSFSFYKHVRTFQKECEIVDLLVEYLIENNCQKIILITYPDAYYNASNLFLQHKGLIEQKFVRTGIDCTLLNVQAIGDAELNINSLHQLFYDKAKYQYVIPKKANNIVYSIQLENLVNIIVKANENNPPGKYDVFDTIFPLKSFLEFYSSIENTKQIEPIFLYFRTYLGTYISLTMLELFLTSVLNLFKYHTEMEFGIQLSPVWFETTFLATQKDIKNYEMGNKGTKLIDHNPYSAYLPSIS